MTGDKRPATADATEGVVTVKEITAHAANGVSSPRDATEVVSVTAHAVRAADGVDSYTKGALLGNGGFALVYEAFLPGGRSVAVKECALTEVVDDGEGSHHKADQAKKEADTLRNISHPNIIQFLDCRLSPCGGFFLIFMERAERSLGQDLQKRKLGREAGFTEPQAIWFVRQILAAVQYLHKRGYIHRDIKPGNILVDAANTVKLADFGLSKLVADSTGRSQRGCKTSVGTPPFMAPEVLRNEEYGNKVDIWSVGCTVMQMLNGGHEPWEETFNSPASAKRVVGYSKALRKNVPDDISDLCRSFLDRCLEREAKQRADVNELLAHPWILTPSDACAASSTSECETGSAAEPNWSGFSHAEVNQSADDHGVPPHPFAHVPR